SLTTSQHEAFIILPPRESSRTPSERVLNPKPSGNATRRARALRGVWRRCSLLTDRCGYARRSRLASRHELLLRGLLLFMRWLLEIRMIIERNENPSSSKLPILANVLTDMSSLVKDARICPAHLPARTREAPILSRSFSTV